MLVVDTSENIHKHTVNILLLALRYCLRAHQHGPAIMMSRRNPSQPKESLNNPEHLPPVRRLAPGVDKKLPGGESPLSWQDSCSQWRHCYHPGAVLAECTIYQLPSLWLYLDGQAGSFGCVPSSHSTAKLSCRGQSTHSFTYSGATTYTVNTLCLAHTHATLTSASAREDRYGIKIKSPLVGCNTPLPLDRPLSRKPPPLVS
jgi:hypothetical protein